MRIPPIRLIYDGKMTTVHTTLIELIRAPVGSTCLYETPRPMAFQSVATKMARDSLGDVCIEPLLALEMDTNKIINICRVTVTQRGQPQATSKAARVNFCAPYGVLARCRVGTSCLYENLNKHDTPNVHNPARKAGGKIKLALYYVIDIKRETTKPIYRVEVIKQGKPYDLATPDSITYKNFF